MDTIVFLLVFLAAALSLAVEPGPGFFRLAAETTLHGRRKGMSAAAGMFAGALPYIIAVAFGLDRLLEAAPELLTVLRIAGGIYLVSLAVGMMRRPTGMPTDDSASGPALRKDARDDNASRGMRGGFLLVFLNPRTPALYASFLPLFLDSGALIPPGLQLLCLGVGLASVFLIVDLVFVITAGRIGMRLSANGTARRIARAIAASALAVFGARLLLAKD
jgi:threonine/homoserine/homoserine lactone efflux protein